MVKKKCRQIWNEFRGELEFYFGQSEEEHADKVRVRGSLVYIILSLSMLLCLVGLYWNSAVNPGLNGSADAYKEAAITEIDERTIAHGDIWDRNGNPIVQTSGVEQPSVYADDTAYSQVVGFTGPTKLVKGNQVSEAQNDYRLMKYLRETLYLTKDVDDTKGCNISLTLDHGLQMAVKEALLQEMMPGEKGSAVVLNAQTGEILAMVSFPTFDTNNLNDGLQTLNHSDPEVEMHYPITHKDSDPCGSIYKMAILVEQIDHGLKDFRVLDNQYEVNGVPISNVYGNRMEEIGYEEAFVDSSNVYFSKMALELGPEILDEAAKKYGIGEYLELDFGTVRSAWDLDPTSNLEIALAGFGQGKVELSTLSAAMVTAAIANDGVLMEPYMIQKVSYADGQVLKEGKPKVYSQVTSKETADLVEEVMKQAGKSYGYAVAAKSGTAENRDARETLNAWYASFQGKYVVVVNQCKQYKGGADLADTADLIYEYLEEHPL